MHQKGLAPILIVILIALLGIGGYFAYMSLRRAPGPVAISPTSTPIVNSTPHPSPSPADETTNWKTYQNLENKYTIKYPSELTALDKTPPWVTFTNDPNGTINISDVSKYIHISLAVYPSADDLMKIIDKDTYSTLPSNKMGSIIQGEIKPYNQSGFNGYVFEGGVEGINKFIYFKKDDKIIKFMISGYQTGSNYKDNKNAEIILENMISTFKFTQ